MIPDSRRDSGLPINVQYSFLTICSFYTLEKPQIAGSPRPSYVTRNPLSSGACRIHSHHTLTGFELYTSVESH